MGRQQIPCKAKPCEWCGTMMQRKRYGTQLEDRSVFSRRRFCNMKCFGLWGATATPSVATVRWRARRDVPKKTACERCGSTRTGCGGIQIHHIDGNPQNNTASNCMTLCGSCHAKWHWEHGKVRHAKPCKVCGIPSRMHGLCMKHWQRFKTHGDPNLTKKRGAGGLYVLVRVSPNE